MPPSHAGDVSVGARWRAGVARQARAIYESAHGNPVSDEARGVRWSMSPQTAVTVCLTVLALGAALLWVVRAPSGAVVADSIPQGGAPAPVTASESGDGTSSSASQPPNSATHWGSSDTDVVVIVDVAGRVATPGIQELASGSRVADAIDAAGGFLPDAARDTANLARVLVDGEQVYIPGVDDDEPAGESGAPPGKVNVNRADANELEGLPGVGPVLAQRILDYREAHGPFASINDLDHVSGIGPALLKQLAEVATV